MVDFLFLGSKITVDSYCSREIRRQLLLGRKAMTNLECAEKQRHYFADKGPYSKGYGLPSGHVWLWKLDSKESRMQNNWCLQTVVREKTPESRLDSKEIKPVHSKGYQPWILIGMTDAEAEAPVFWSPDANSQLITDAKDMSLERLWEMVAKEWMKGGLACCNPWGCKESDTAGRLNSNSDIAGAQYYMLQVYNIVIHNLSKLFSIILHL